ncbi:MAG: hypothetical protein QW101_08175 [Ignisphaera sp.]|uniref:hypothetical protein n=1 Tax=Saccharolobus sp. TaxID=2100761 RepID=UPI003178572B
MAEIIQDIIKIVIQVAKYTLVPLIKHTLEGFFYAMMAFLRYANDITRRLMVLIR